MTIVKIIGTTVKTRIEISAGARKGTEAASLLPFLFFILLFGTISDLPQSFLNMPESRIAISPRFWKEEMTIS
jgi:hypothetical protein